MEKVDEVGQLNSGVAAGKIPVSVIIAVRNEAKNLPQCLEGLKEFDDVYVIDSQSTDDTVEIARSYGAHIVQFHYAGGWPKKRQWAMNTLPLAQDWILLLDADEVLTTAVTEEIRSAVSNPAIDGYSILLRTWF
ncbi:MAG: glycosyltransferase family 2 protein, partial [Candidatus Sulfotelmatobacter sp.]